MMDEKALGEALFDVLAEIGKVSVNAPLTVNIAMLLGFFLKGGTIPECVDVACMHDTYILNDRLRKQYLKDTIPTLTNQLAHLLLEITTEDVTEDHKHQYICIKKHLEYMRTQQIELLPKYLYFIVPALGICKIMLN
jgi:hypothetical protein